MDRRYVVRIIYMFIISIIFNIMLKEYFSFLIINMLLGVYYFVEFILEQLDFYEERFRYKDIFKTLVINVLFSLILLIFFKELKIILNFIVLIIVQLIFRKIVCQKYMKKKNVLIFGSDHIQNNVQEDVISNMDYNYIGYISNNKSRATEYLVGRYDEMEKIISEKNIQILIIVKDVKNEDFKQYIKRMFDLKLQGIKIFTYDDFMENIQKKIDINKVNEDWILQSSGFEILNNETHIKIKRGLDIILAIILFIISVPIWIIIPILIKLDSKGSVIFKQYRIGQNKRKFKVYKFRTMKEHNVEEHSKYASENDNRITKLGNFMRKTRIDELPQLWNVLIGNMSFIGPRPEWDILAKEYEKSIPYYNLRYFVRPGITGWAQVMYPYGENLEDTKRKLEYDLYYIKKQNLLLDVLTVMKTVKAVLYGRGK